MKRLQEIVKKHGARLYKDHDHTRDHPVFSVYVEKRLISPTRTVWVGTIAIEKPQFKDWRVRTSNSDIYLLNASNVAHCVNKILERLPIDFKPCRYCDADKEDGQIV